MAIKLKVCVARPRALLPLLAAAALLLLRCCCCCRFRLGFASFCRAFACVCELASSFAVAVVVVVVRRRHLLSATSNRLFHLQLALPLRISRDSYLFVAFKLFISIALFFVFLRFSLCLSSCFAQFFIVCFL